MNLDESILQTKTAHELIKIIKRIHRPNQEDTMTNMIIKKVYRERNKAMDRIGEYSKRGMANQLRGKSNE